MTTHLSVLVFGSLFLAGCAKHNGDFAVVGFGGVVKFETRVEIPTGIINHSDHAVADFDGDGFLDIAVVGLDGDVRVLLGSGSTFATGQPLTLPGTPIWVASADLDGDGDLDLAVVRTDADETSILLNDGNANFTPGAVLPVGEDALAIVLGDADHDGFADVIVARLVSPELVVYVNDGTGNFTLSSGLVMPGGGTPFNMALGDVDMDQRMDLVVCDSILDRILIFFGGGKDFGGLPHVFSCGEGPRAVNIADFDHDGSPDIAVSAFDENKVEVFTDYLGQFPDGFDLYLDGPPTMMTSGDVTGDGIRDLAVCVSAQASIVVFPGVLLGGGGGNGNAFGDPFQLDSSGLPLRPFIGDSDGDGKNELFALSGYHDRINLWLAKQDGTLAGARNHATGIPLAFATASADFDGDGASDVIAAGYRSDRVAVLVRAPNDTLEVAYSIDVGRVIYRATTVDLDRDGKSDVLLSVDGGAKILRNQSTAGVFEFAVLPGAGSEVFGIGAGPFGVAIADLDGDGNLDIVGADFQGGSLQVLRGSATAFAFAEPSVVHTIGGGPIDVVAADFTGEGILDVAVSRAGASDILVMRNDGAGNLTQFASIPVGAAPNYLITHDFDRDGRADMVVSNGNAASLTVLFARAVGFDAVPFPAGATPTALLAQDLTADGHTDILVTSLVDGDFRVLAGDGRGGFPGLFPFPGTLGATSAALADVIGDGHPDLLIGSIITNRISVVKNLGN